MRTGWSLLYHDQCVCVCAVEKSACLLVVFVFACSGHDSLLRLQSTKTSEIRRGSEGQ